MRLPIRTTVATRAAGFTCVAVVGFVAGCWASDTSVARDTFAATYSCPKNQVSVSGNGQDVPIEAVGCGHSAQYSCIASSPACTSAQETAVSAASDAWSCPRARIQVGTNRALAAPEPPPADVAADPARLAIWQQHHAGPTVQRTFSTSGCGKQEDVLCVYSLQTWIASGLPASGGMWSCSMPPPSSSEDVHGIAQALLAAETGQFACMGPLVLSVRPDSPASKAGLSAGDVILEIDHQAIGDDRAAAKKRIDELAHSPGMMSHVFHVRRKATTLDLTIPRELPPGSSSLVPPGSPPASPPSTPPVSSATR